MFGPFKLDPRQIFFETRLSRAIVNLKPITAGHVLVIPKRPVARISMLTEEETLDLFLSVRKISLVIESHYCAEGLNVAVQDGAVAGQSVPHVHVHILPRRKGDFKRNDDVYDELDNQNLQESYQKLNVTDDRVARTMEDMAVESTALRVHFPENIPNDINE